MAFIMHLMRDESHLSHEFINASISIICSNRGMVYWLVSPRMNRKLTSSIEIRWRLYY